MLRLTAIPCRGSRDECDVQTKFPDSRDVLGRIAVNKVDLHVRVARAEGTQQIEQKS